MLAKEKRDLEGRLLRIKRRLILDCKESRVNRAASLTQRLVLPRATDLIDDILAMLWWNDWEAAQVGFSLVDELLAELVVLDFVDAF